MGSVVGRRRFGKRYPRRDIDPPLFSSLGQSIDFEREEGFRAPFALKSIICLVKTIESTTFHTARPLRKGRRPHTPPPSIPLAQSSSVHLLLASTILC